MSTFYPEGLASLPYILPIDINIPFRGIGNHDIFHPHDSPPPWEITFQIITVYIIL